MPHFLLILEPWTTKNCLFGLWATERSWLQRLLPSSVAGRYSRWRGSSGPQLKVKSSPRSRLLHLKCTKRGCQSLQVGRLSHRNSASTRQHYKVGSSFQPLQTLADRLPDFLRLSRGMIDDSIVQNLNALMTPSTKPWDPASTSERQIRPVERRPTDPQACQSFKNEVLFQSWQTRSDVLNYCAGVALDPSDPDLALKQVESPNERERVIDERLDPYSGRFFPREARTEILGNLIRNERSVEGIIRSRTWGLVSERCGDHGTGWEEALNRWREDREAHR